MDSGYASSPHDAFSVSSYSIKSQYLGALYSMRTSLAHFAKSSLPRARSEFQIIQSPDGSLILSLQDLVLNDGDFNAKYDSFLPSLVRHDANEIPLFITEEEHVYLMQKFMKIGNGVHDINDASLQQELSNLRIREYLSLFLKTNLEHNSKSSFLQNYLPCTKNVKTAKEAWINQGKLSMRCY